MPALGPTGKVVAEVAHRALAVTLLLVGLGMRLPALKRLGERPLVEGVVLWGVLGVGDARGDPRDVV